MESVLFNESDEGKVISKKLDADILTPLHESLIGRKFFY